MKQKITCIYARQFAMTCFLLIAILIKSNSQPINFNILSCTQVSYQSPFHRPFSNDFELNFSYSNLTTNTPYFLNAYIRQPFTNNQDWIVQNILLDTFSGVRELTYTMKLGSLGYVDLVPVNILDIAYFITDTVMYAPIMVPPTAYNPLPVTTSIWDWGSGHRIDSILQSLNLLPPNDFLKKDSLRSVTRGCHMPNLDLDSSKHNPTTVAGYANDWNSCVPTSCANSMQWLEARHPASINSGLSHIGKLEEFSKLMKRQTNQGVTTDTMIMGKLEYIDKYKLPIHVKFQDLFITDTNIRSFSNKYKNFAKNMSKDLNNAAKPKLDFEWLFEEMKQGEDVEMLVQWVVDSAGTVISRSGHAVVVSGVEDINGVTRIVIKDDSSQAKAGGTRERPLTFDTTGSQKYPKIKEWGWTSGPKTAKCYVTGWVSESYDTSIKFVSVNELQNSAYDYVVTNNPFDADAPFILSLNAKKPTKLKITIYDIMGHSLITLFEGTVGSGTQNFSWDGSTTNCNEVSTGLYFLTIVDKLNTTVIKVAKK